MSRSLGLILSAFALLSVVRPVTGQEVANSLPEAVDAPDQVSAAPPPANTVVNPDDAWHIGLTLYLWFAGAHGTMGTSRREVDFHASAGDLLSNARFGVMGAVAAQRGRYILFSDLLWVRLGADKQRELPFAGLPELSADFKAYELIVNPEAGYRVLDGKRFKLDGLLGLRYWHVGSKVEFTPSPAGLNFSQSKNWVDPLMGVRIEVPLSPKVLATARGDVGSWGAAQLDYQILGTLSYKLKPKLTLGVGYRYLFVNYRPQNFVYQTAMSGAVVGMTYNIK
jgi:hypothetical protein